MEYRECLLRRANNCGSGLPRSRCASVAAWHLQLIRLTSPNSPLRKSLRQSRAENWGTYVTVHGYTVRAINQALDAGVKVIEHGQLLDEKTLQRMVDEGALSFQPFTHHHEDNLNDAQNAKQAIVADGTEGIYKLIKAMPDLR